MLLKSNISPLVFVRRRCDTILHFGPGRLFCCRIGNYCVFKINPVSSLDEWIWSVQRALCIAVTVGSRTIDAFGNERCRQYRHIWRRALLSMEMEWKMENLMKSVVASSLSTFSFDSQQSICQIKWRMIESKIQILPLRQFGILRLRIFQLPFGTDELEYWNYHSVCLTQWIKKRILHFPQEIFGYFDWLASGAK